LVRTRAVCVIAYRWVLSLIQLAFALVHDECFQSFHGVVICQAVHIFLAVVTVCDNIRCIMLRHVQSFGLDPGFERTLFEQ
jgi:hypothetical protein